MSSLIVDICEIKEIKPHPNADRLEIAVVKGWECCVKKDEFKPTDKIIYFPVDTVLPQSVSDKFGVTSYLSKGRIRAARLRGFPSCGLIMPCNDEIFSYGVNKYIPKSMKNPYPIGTNVADTFGCIKWEPAPKLGIQKGQQEREHPLFVRYTDIENIKHFPDILQEGEEVVITEKIHGTNSRVGLLNGQFVAGSHNTQRKDPDKSMSFKEFFKDIFHSFKRWRTTGKWKRSNNVTSNNDTYWMPLKNESLKTMMKELSNVYSNAQQVVVFGEIFGKGVQDLNYGRQGQPDYRVFDVYINGKYLDYPVMLDWCNRYKIPTVPLLYRGPWNKDLIIQYTSGNSVESLLEQIREGFVVKPITERRLYNGDRVIYKSISFEYLERKNPTEDH